MVIVLDSTAIKKSTFLFNMKKISQLFEIILPKDEKGEKLSAYFSELRRTLPTE
jgi:hypothetical protein